MINSVQLLQENSFYILLFLFCFLLFWRIELGHFGTWLLIMSSLLYCGSEVLRRLGKGASVRLHVLGLTENMEGFDNWLKRGDVVLVSAV